MRKAKIEEYAIKYTTVIDRYEKVMRQKGKFLIAHPGKNGGKMGGNWGRV